MGTSTAAKAVVSTEITLIAQACHEAGGPNALAEQIGAPVSTVQAWLDGRPVDPSFCPALEKTPTDDVTCDLLRPDLYWLRDGADEVMGFVTPLNGATVGLIEQAVAGAHVLDRASPMNWSASPERKPGTSGVRPFHTRWTPDASATVGECLDDALALLHQSEELLMVGDPDWNAQTLASVSFMQMAKALIEDAHKKLHRGAKQA
jgi:DNA-binding transcriptional regulator YdaS (Cro superfamily)